MRISFFAILSIVVLLPCIVYGEQTDTNESIQADNTLGNNGELDVKGEDVSTDEKETKPRKTTFKEERFEKLFNNRLRKPRLTAPKYHQRPKPQLPSFFKNPPSVKPLGQDGLPVDEAPKPTPASSRPKQTPHSRANTSKTTTTVAPRTRSRASTTTTTARPSLNDSSKRFSSSSRGRISSSSSNSSPSVSSRGRLN